MVVRWTEVERLRAHRSIQSYRFSPYSRLAENSCCGGVRFFDRLAGEWLDDFERRGVTAGGFGWIVLRRPRSSVPARLLRVERLPEPLGAAPTGIGDHLMAGIAAHDATAHFDDAALAALRLHVAGDVTEKRHQWPGAEGPTVIRLRQGGGFGRTVEADAPLAGLVGACDGELSIGRIVGALSALLEIDEAALTAELLPRVRELLLTGMLLLEP